MKTVEKLFEIIAKIMLIKGLFSPLLVHIYLKSQVNTSLRPYVETSTKLFTRELL